MENDVTKTTATEGEELENGQLVGQTDTNPAASNAGAGTADGGSTAADQQAAATGKTYTDEQLADLKAQWQQEYEQSQAQAKDFAKLTPAQQIQKLQADLADRDLTDYARSKMEEAKLPSDALTFIKGKDQADTDAKIKAFSALLAAGVQSGVEGRFQQNGYTPRGSAAGKTEEGSKKRTRGVTYNEKK